MAVQQWTYFTIQNSVPFAPTITGIGQVPGATPTLSLSWTANPSGRPAAGYQIYFYRSDGVLVRGPINGATSGTQYTLTTAPIYGSNYYATIAGSNFAGILAPVTTSGSVKYGQAPILAPVVTMNAWTTATPTSVSMTWAAPTTLYTYAPIDYYYIAIGTGNTVGNFSRVQFTNTPNTTIYTFSTSTNVYSPVIGTTFYALVQPANNLFGLGVAGISGTGTVYGTVPASVSPVSLSWNTNTISTMTYTWTNSANNTYNTASTYWLQIFYNTGNTAVNTSLNNATSFWGPFSSAQYGITNTTYANGGSAFGAFTIGNYYSAAVWASNAIGSNISVSGTTRYGAAPAQVGGLACLLVSGSYNQIQIYWTNAVNSTYNTISGNYNINIYDSIGSIYNSGYDKINTSFSNSPYYSHGTNLVIGRYYFCIVSASNLIGVTTTTSSAFTYGSSPPVVTGQSITINYSAQSLTVSWSVPTTTPFNTIASISVQLYFSNGTASGSAVSLSGSSTTVTYSAGSLSVPSTYYAIITTTNALGSATARTANAEIVLQTPTIKSISNNAGWNTFYFDWYAVWGATSYILYTNGNSGVNIGNVTSWYNPSIVNTYVKYTVAATNSAATSGQSPDHGTGWYTSPGTYTLDITGTSGTAIVMAGGGGAKPNRCPAAATGGSGGYVYGYLNNTISIKYVIVGGGGGYDGIVGHGGYNGGAAGGDNSYWSGGGGGISGIYAPWWGAYVLVGGGGGCGGFGTSGTNKNSPIGCGGNGGTNSGAQGGGSQGGTTVNWGLANGGVLNGGAGGVGGSGGAGGTSSWASGANASYSSGGQGGNPAGSGGGQGGGGAGGWGGGGGGGGQWQTWSTDRGHWGERDGQSQSGGAGGGGGSDYTGYVTILDQRQGATANGSSTEGGAGGNGYVYIYW